LLGKLTICIDNAGPLWGHCIVAILPIDEARLKMFLKPPKRSKMEIKRRNSNHFKKILNTLRNQCMTKCISPFAKDLVTATKAI
jgi:hypothetical protein